MTQHDLIVIGGGPGGYVAAIRAAQLGMNVAIVEKEAILGGTCLRVGCIPSKALLESSERYVQAAESLEEHGIKAAEVAFELPAMMKRKQNVVKVNAQGLDALMKKNKITRYRGRAKIAGQGRVDVETGDKPERPFTPALSPSGGEASVRRQSLQAKHVIIATGSKTATLPGVQLDGDKVGTSTEALAYQEVPKHLVVIGAGYIGVELGSVWRRLGANVTVLEYLDRILAGMDAEIAADAHKILKKQGLEFHLGAKVTAARADKKGCVVEYEGGEPIRCDRVLVAVGRQPNTDGLALDAVGIATDDNGRINVDDTFRTNVPGFYAIGDVIPGPMLAHKAEEEGVACVEAIATGYGHVNYDAIPGVVYTHPEIASVGKTEEQLQQSGVEYKKGVFPLRANSRARILGQTEGKIKILADAATDRILGVHMIGPRAGDLIAEAVVAIEFGATAEDIARCSHAHPTVPEAVREAALAVDGRTIHL